MSRPVTLTREELLRIAAPGSVLHELALPRKKPTHPEHEAQVEYLRDYVPYLKAKYPADAHLFDLTYANPQWMGTKTAKQGDYLKAEGKKAGIPDLTHPVARLGYHGLYIENKIERTKLSDAQRDWAKRLSDQGYAVVVCRADTPAMLAKTIAATIEMYTLGNRNWYKLLNPDEIWI